MITGAGADSNGEPQLHSWLKKYYNRGKYAILGSGLVGVTWDATSSSDF